MFLLAQDEDGLWRFLGPVAGAAVTGIVSLILWWLNKTRPQKVLVKETEIVTLLRIAETLRPRIKATLDSHPVNNLSQIELAIMNAGTDTIKDIILDFGFPETTGVLECELSGVTAEKKLDWPHKMALSIPFLNAYRHHGECLTAKIVCDGSVQGLLVKGRGEGWSAEHITTEKALKFWFRVTGGCLCLFTVMMIAYPIFMRSVLDIRGDEWSVRSLLAYSLLLIVMITSLVIVHLTLKGMRRRLRAALGRKP